MTAPTPALLFSATLSAAAVPHAFTTRRAGVSSGMFDSLNFGNPGDLPVELRDPPAHIHANWQTTLHAIGCGDRQLVEVHQVHGAAVEVIRESPAEPGRTPSPKADAIVTDNPALAIAVRIADCTPVLLSSRDGRVVAAVHAGWRGVIDGVAMEAVRTMAALDALPHTLIAAIGPCIGPANFEVGPEVALEFHRVFGEYTPHVRPHPTSQGKFLVDLKAALAEQLRIMAIPRTGIDILPHCTFAEPDLFFSHRRDQGRTGRMAAVISPRA